MDSFTNPVPPNAKVLFRVPNDDGDAFIETLWATPLGSNSYKIDNSPFFTYGISWGDVVYAPYNSDEGFPTFQSVIAKSGNCTVRVMFDLPIQAGNESDKLLQGLVRLGCSFECANNVYVSVNIPPAIDLVEVRNYLIQRDAQWEHADPTYETYVKV